MNRYLTLLCATALLIAGRAHAQLPIDTYTLSNGLRVALVEDHSAPLVTVDIWYNVGSAHEQPGRTGLAHLLQYLMFQGSANVERGEHFRLVHEAGGRVSASSGEDRTQYLQTLPANELKLGLWLEADRMRSLAITDEALRTQRDRLREERRYRVENQPYSAAFLDGLPLAFDSTTCFAYAHSAFGAPADIDSLNLEDAQDFFDRFYRPNNATLTVVGDFDGQLVRETIQEYFGSIPRGSDPGEPPCRAPIPSGAGTHVWNDQLARLPGIIRAYRIPPHANPDRLPLAVATSLMGHGEEARLHRALVVERGVAVQVGVQMDSRRAPGLLYLYAIAAEHVTADSLLRSLESEVARLAAGSVTESEVQRATAHVRTSALARRTTTEQMAEEVQHFMHFHSSTQQMRTDLDTVRDISLDDVRRVATAYFDADNSFTIVVEPAASGGHAHDGDAP